jgi:hypothetical protein
VWARGKNNVDCTNNFRFLSGRETRSGHPRILTLAGLPCSNKSIRRCWHITLNPRGLPKLPPNFAASNPNLCASQVNPMPRPTKQGLRRRIEPFQQLDLQACVDFEAVIMGLNLPRRVLSSRLEFRMQFVNVKYSLSITQGSRKLKNSSAHNLQSSNFDTSSLFRRECILIK